MHWPRVLLRTRDDRSVPRSPLPRRRMAALTLMGAWLGASAWAGEVIEVWLELDVPPPGLQAGASAAEQRIALVRAQQDGIAARLPALGAIELARVQQVGNAMAVRIDADRIAELSALPGVKRVRPVRTLHPPRPMP